MEIGIRHWLTVLSVAMLLHAYAIWNLNLTTDSVETDLLTRYTIDLTTFKAPPEPIKLKPFIPPPPEKVEAPKPEIKPQPKPKPKPVKKPKPIPKQPAKVVVPELEQPIMAPEPMETAPPVEAPKITPSVTPTPSQAEIDLEKAKYYQHILDKLERLKKYPSRARRRGEQGTVRLTFSLHKDGSLNNHEITKSSGSRNLDQAVEELIVRAAPFPPIPDSMGTGKLELSVPISFALH